MKSRRCASSSMVPKRTLESGEIVPVRRVDGGAGAEGRDLDELLPAAVDVNDPEPSAR